MRLVKIIDTSFLIPSIGKKSSNYEEMLPAHVDVSKIKDN